MVMSKQIRRSVARVGCATMAAAASALLLFSLRQEASAQSPGDGARRTLRGTIDRFTTAKKGEVDGCVLGDGTRVYWPPHLGERVSSSLAKGDRIRVTGRTESGKKGETKFEARSVTNLRNDQSVLFDDRPGTARAAPAGEGGEERLRALERRLEDLLREVKDLRRTR